MNLIKQKLKTISVWLLVQFLPVVAFAQSGLQPPPRGIGNLPDFSGNQGVAGLIISIIKLMLLFASLVSVLFIILGGYQYMFSGANEDLAKRGKTTLTNAVIGLVIIILSFTIVNILYNEFAGNLPSRNIGNGCLGC